MRTLNENELDIVSGGADSLGASMAEGALYGGMVGFFVGGPAGMLAGAIDGAAAAGVIFGMASLRSLMI